MYAKGISLRYTYNETGGLINGVIFYFERGDEEIAARTFRLIDASEQIPTSIVRDGHGFDAAIRLTTSEDRLLKQLLGFFRETYPALAPMVGEINDRVFGTPQ